MRDYLLRIVCNEEIEVREKKTRTPRQSVYVIEKNTEDKKKKKKEDQSGFFSRFAVKKHPQKDENTALNQLESEEMNVKLPQKHKKQKQVEVLEIKESKAVEDKKLVDSNLKEEKAVNQTAAQEVIEHIETTESDWQPVESSAVQKQEKQPEVINIEHIDLEFSSSRSVKLDDVPFEFDYSRKDRDGGEI